MAIATPDHPAAGAAVPSPLDVITWGIGWTRRFLETVKSATVSRHSPFGPKPNAEALADQDRAAVGLCVLWGTAMPRWIPKIFPMRRTPGAWSAADRPWRHAVEQSGRAWIFPVSGEVYSEGS
jgi:hypothetical protein